MTAKNKIDVSYIQSLSTEDRKAFLEELKKIDLLEELTLIRDDIKGLLLEIDDKDNLLWLKSALENDGLATLVSKFKAKDNISKVEKGKKGTTSKPRANKGGVTEQEIKEYVNNVRKEFISSIGEDPEVKNHKPEIKAKIKAYMNESGYEYIEAIKGEDGKLKKPGYYYVTGGNLEEVKNKIQEGKTKA